ncbi:protein asteroid homolog 1-like [Salmo salar]|uniref:Protein asteroid homolog 1-like n=1 Tax=Salmo salar TaxID=8030 RepID=A0ABM3ERR2_SALSA|nr:protein asteroid homolog 1-like [Salmo salar]
MVKAILPSAAKQLQLNKLDQAPHAVRLEVFLETLGFIEEGPVLERLRGLIQRGARSLDLGVAHAYSQWQRCMRDGLDLNQLLCFPLPEPQCAWLYRGTLVHQLVDELRGVVTPDSLLMEDPSSGQLYRAMLEAILNSQETETTGQPDGPSADSGAGG